MTALIFRDFPGVSNVERQLDLHARDRLLDDDLEELPHLIDETSVALFGITQRHTFYSALPEPVRLRFSRVEWEEQFDVLGHHPRDPNAHWRTFDLDLCCAEGSSLHCLEVFGRQLVCALHGLHPQAVTAFANQDTAQAA